MATTPNFNWSTPDNTGLVRNGALDIRTLGNSIDASLVDLKGGTTGQVLAKASGTDMDFSWVAQDDSNAIQNSLLTTTGDTIFASAANTPARRAIGTTGQVLTVSGGVPVWATPAGGGGKVLQVVQTTSTSTTSNSTSTYADATGLSVTITPSASTSRIMIQVVHQVYISPANADNSLQLRILRGATNIHQYGTELGLIGTAVKKQLQMSAVYIDSPATTSATTYKVVFANFVNGASVAINDPASTMVMIATEIGA